MVNTAKGPCGQTGLVTTLAQAAEQKAFLTADVMKKANICVYLYIFARDLELTAPAYFLARVYIFVYIYIHVRDLRSKPLFNYSSSNIVMVSWKIGNFND